jgi:uncharacterized protein (TIGR02594 family)
LQVDGVVGPLTLAKMFGDGVGAVAVNVAIPWLAEAQRLRGLKEVQGAANNPVIMGWAEGLNLDYAGDDVPWCGLFVAHCIAAVLPGEPQPANPLGARQWLKFGRDVVPQVGAVMVFWRGSRDGWTGHVALYVGEDSAAYHVLGGNQSDAVTVTKISKSRLLGARWPVSVDAPGWTNRDGGDGAGLILSTNEA